MSIGIVLSTETQWFKYGIPGPSSFLAKIDPANGIGLGRGGLGGGRGGLGGRVVLLNLCARSQGRNGAQNVSA